MQRTALAFAALGVAACSCLAVAYALRDRPAPTPEAAAPAPRASALRAERPDGAAPAVAAAPAAERPPAPEAVGEARFLAELARASEAQEEALRAALLGVAEDESLALEARLDRYRDALRKARDQAPGSRSAFDHPGMRVEAFLRVDAVQRELAALSPAARSHALAHIRRELGLPEQEIARMEEIDERREARWQNGLAYLQERARIEATFEGEALEEELRALREEYFGEEAPTIEAEERSGFHRFRRPRVYGRN